jgi:hypothetical protein
MKRQAIGMFFTFLFLVDTDFYHYSNIMSVVDTQNEQYTRSIWEEDDTFNWFVAPNLSLTRAAILLSCHQANMEQDDIADS